MRLAVDEPATWTARVVPADTTAVASGQELTANTELLSRAGTIRRGWFSWIKLPRKRLPAGLYRIEVEVTSRQNPDRTVMVSGPQFKVKKRPVRDTRGR